MRTGTLLMCLGSWLLLTACGHGPMSATDSASPNATDTGTGTGGPDTNSTGNPAVNPALQPLLDKRLQLTHLSVLDSNGRYREELCDGARDCHADAIVLTSDGHWIIDECDAKCPLEDPRNERAAWTLDEDGNALIVTDDNLSNHTYRIVAATDTSILLAIPGEDINGSIARATGGGANPSDPGATLLQTFTVE
jgi:hypothetical protein